MPRVIRDDAPKFIVVDDRMGQAPRDYHSTALGAYEDLALTLMYADGRYWFGDASMDSYHDIVRDRLARWLMWVDAK